MGQWEEPFLFVHQCQVSLQAYVEISSSVLWETTQFILMELVLNLRQKTEKVDPSVQ